MTRQALVLALLAACSNKPPGDVADDRGGGRTAAVSDWTTDPVEVIRQAGPIPVSGVALTAEADADRVTFTFDGGLPGYHIGYVDAPVHCGSGEPAAMEGKAWLEVRMTPAAAHDDAGHPLIGPVGLDAAAQVVTDLEPTCDFEAEVTWVIGVSSKQPFKTQELLGPQRLVVDIKR